MACPIFSQEKSLTLNTVTQTPFLLFSLPCVLMTFFFLFLFELLVWQEELYGEGRGFFS